MAGCLRPTTGRGPTPADAANRHCGAWKRGTGPRPASLARCSERGLPRARRPPRRRAHRAIGSRLFPNQLTVSEPGLTNQWEPWQRLIDSIGPYYRRQLLAARDRAKGELCELEEEQLAALAAEGRRVASSRRGGHASDRQLDGGP